MAIKGKSKRSQGRPVRRPATGPRIQTVERRLPWYRATAYPVTLAEIAGHRTVAGVLAAAAARTIVPITPELVGRDEAQLRLALPDGREISVPAGLAATTRADSIHLE